MGFFRRPAVAVLMAQGPSPSMQSTRVPSAESSPAGPAQPPQHQQWTVPLPQGAGSLVIAVGPGVGGPQLLGTGAVAAVPGPAAPLLPPEAPERHGRPVAAPHPSLQVPLHRLPLRYIVQPEQGFQGNLVYLARHQLQLAASLEQQAYALTDPRWHYAAVGEWLRGGGGRMAASLDNVLAQLYGLRALVPTLSALLSHQLLGSPDQLAADVQAFTHVLESAIADPLAPQARTLFMDIQNGNVFALAAFLESLGDLADALQQAIPVLRYTMLLYRFETDPPAPRTTPE